MGKGVGVATRTYAQRPKGARAFLRRHTPPCRVAMGPLAFGFVFICHRSGITPRQG